MRLIIFFSIVIIISGCISASAQETPAVEARPQTVATPIPGRPANARPNFLSQIGLTPEQFQQIRRLNIERKPIVEAAQSRLKEANRALDAAIYSDQTSEADLESKIRDVQSAQSEMIRLRSANEFAVRKVLTPDQLVKFRELRQEFEQVRNEIEARKKERQAIRKDSRPIRRLIRQTQPKATH